MAKGTKKNLLGPQFGNASEKAIYEQQKRNLNAEIQKNSNMYVGTHYTIEDMLYPSKNRSMGEWVMIYFRNISNGPSADQNKVFFEAKLGMILEIDRPLNPPKKENLLFVKIVKFTDEIYFKSKAQSIPGRAGQNDDEPNVRQNLIENLKEVFNLLCIPMVPNKDQVALEEDWLMCNLYSEEDTKNAYEVLTSMGIISGIREDKKCNLSIALTEKISNQLLLLRTKPAVKPLIYTGNEAIMRAEWIIRKFFRDVESTPPEFDNGVGLSGKWFVNAKIKEILATLDHYGVIAIDCGTNRVKAFSVIKNPRGVYEFLKTHEEISYELLNKKLNSLIAEGGIYETPDDFENVVPFEFKTMNVAEATKVDVPRKKYRYHDDVYSLILTKLGIPAYNQYSPLVKSIKISNSKTPNKEGKDYHIILILRDEDNSSTKQDIIDTLDPVGYDCHYVGEKEGKKLSKKTICFYPKKEKEIALQNPEPAIVAEKLAEKDEIKPNAEPTLIPNLVDSFSLIMEAILSQLKPEQIKMLVTLIPALKPETPEPKIVDKTVDNVDKLLQFYKLVPAEKSDAYNASYFATKEQVLELLLSEDK